MIFNFISSAVIPFNIIDSYNIKSQDFVSRCPNWMFDCLREIAAYKSYTTKVKKYRFNNNRMILPKFCMGVELVIINGIKADYSDKLYSLDTNINLNREVIMDGDIDVNPNANVHSIDTSGDSDFEKSGTYISFENEGYPSMSETRSLYNIYNGWLHTNVSHGYIEIKYKCYEYTLDSVLGLEFIIIPDDINVIKAMENYVLKTLLMRGYVHPVLNLANNNPFTNPAIAYEKYLGLARNSINSMSIGEREKLFKPMATLFGRRRDIYIKGEDLKETNIPSISYQWIDAESYCETVNNQNTGYLVQMEKKQMFINNIWVDVDEPHRQKSKVLNTTACPIVSPELPNIYICVSYPDYDYETEVKLNYASGSLSFDTPTKQGFSYFFISVPANRNFSLLDSLNQDLKPTMIDLGQDNRGNDLYRLPDVYASTFATTFILTLI